MACTMPSILTHDDIIFHLATNLAHKGANDAYPHALCIHGYSITYLLEGVRLGVNRETAPF